ncbi:MAG: prephenate dehydratase domain-containing protein [Acidobacteriota bacterium]|nr:prephenate dehydratase domain-containing protein [Acidobacteriota bacterium]
MTDLTELRERINRIDSQILDLFQQRMAVAADIAECKAAAGRPVYDRRRERENIQRAADAVPPELSGYAAVLESVLMEAARASEYRRIGRRDEMAGRIAAALASQPTVFPQQAFVACQGVEGAYQQIAVDKLFRHAQISFFDTFEGVFRAIEEGLCKFGVIPVENSTAGSVTHVYDLMMRHDFHIVRSCRLRIDHNLLVNPGTRREDVRIVYSHEQAIAQCAGYIAQIPDCRVHVCENTATAAEQVARSGRTDVAALASRDCASLYGLEIADRSVQDQSNNYTRFACIQRGLSIYPGADRSSLMVVTSHEPGALFKVLARFYALDINLLKLESRPIPDRDFEFMFYFDIECPAAAPQFLTLVGSLSDVCEEWRYLGSYAEAL